MAVWTVVSKPEEAGVCWRGFFLGALERSSGCLGLEMSEGRMALMPERTTWADLEAREGRLVYLTSEIEWE